MAEGKYHLQWRNRLPVLGNSIYNLYQDNVLTDVTIIAGDFTPFRTHKHILYASSQFFKALFSMENMDKTSIFLKGVNSNNLNRILDYIYLGELNIPESEVDEFLNLAQELEIEGIGPIDLVDSSENSDQEKTVIDQDMKDDIIATPIGHEKPNENNSSRLKLDEDCTECSKLLKGQILDPEMIQFHIRTRHRIIRYFPCEICDKKFHKKHLAHQHKLRIHDKILTTICSFCDKTFASGTSLKTHIEGVHEKKRYNCNLCGFSATQKYAVSTHKERYHK